MFSPHPDDDVISMGGILRKLVQNRNENTVAYMTSGNIAVFDHDVRRYVDLLQRLARDGHLEAADVGRLAETVTTFEAAIEAIAIEVERSNDTRRSQCQCQRQPLTHPSATRKKRDARGPSLRTPHVHLTHHPRSSH